MYSTSTFFRQNTTHATYRKSAPRVCTRGRGRLLYSTTAASTRARADDGWAGLTRENLSTIVERVLLPRDEAEEGGQGGAPHAADGSARLAARPPFQTIVHSFDPRRRERAHSVCVMGHFDISISDSSDLDTTRKGSAQGRTKGLPLPGLNAPAWGPQASAGTPQARAKRIKT